MHRVLFAAMVLTIGVIEHAYSQVVAIGSSETQGFGVAASESYPAQLEALLRQRGINVTVSNQGISGDSTDDMFNRLDSAVPAGTTVVIFYLTSNDAKHYNNHGRVIDTDSNVAAIVSKLRSRGIKVIAMSVSSHLLSIAEQAGASSCGNGNIYTGVPAADRSSFHAHMNAHGYSILAAKLLPCVVRALGERGRSHSS